jgi:hypothetical protein
MRFPFYTQIYLKVINMQELEIVKEFFPGINDEEAESILMNRTGWPVFFRTDDHKTEIRESLAKLKAIIDAGKIPCETCNNPAVIHDDVSTSCKRCFKTLGGKDYWFHRIKSKFYALTRRKNKV